MTLFQKKLVAVLNKNKNVGVVMNALAHMSIGLGANHIIKEEFRFTNYKDASGNDHKNISEMPFIVLEGNSNKIRELRHSAIENEVEFVDYTNTMTEGTYKEQIQKSFQTKEEDLEYFGIVLFGDWNKVSELTRRFSLLR